MLGQRLRIVPTNVLDGFRHFVFQKHVFGNVLNIVVEAFLDEELHFNHIASYLQKLMSLLDRWRQKPECPNYLQHINSVDDALAADRWGRSQLRHLLETTS